MQNFVHNSYFWIEKLVKEQQKTNVFFEKHIFFLPSLSAQVALAIDNRQFNEINIAETFVTAANTKLTVMKTIINWK